MTIKTAFQEFMRLRTSLDALRNKRTEDAMASLSAFTKGLRSMADEYLELAQHPFSDLSNRLEDVQKQIREEIRLRASDFNIFRILGIGFLEVTTHTPLLRALLDPRGPHAQGNLFFIQFCRMLGLPDPEAKHTGWSMVPWQQDNVDIRVENYQLGKAIFIENKIYSGTHSGQLTNYFELWKTRFPRGGRFVYLSIYGGMPEDAGFSEHQLYPKTVIIEELSRLSYKTDILRWVQDCLIEVQPVRLRDILQQYIEVIHCL